jgi:hypothetical protein
MISGRQTLDTITRALKEERRRLDDVDARLRAANERIVALDTRRVAEMEALARVRVGHLARRPASELERSDDRIAARLAEREEARAALEAALRKEEARLAALEEQRPAHAEGLERASAELDAAEAATQERLEADPAYGDQRRRAEDAERTARHADDKARSSEEERAAKGAAFEADPIFMDLWRRGFGTRSYRPGLLGRFLDRPIARLVGFEANRANYARLVDLPLRLREHAEHLAAVADEEWERLKALDEAARQEDGVVDLEAARDEVAAALDAHDTAIGEAESARQERFDELERIDRGEDDAYAEIVATLARELAREDLQALRREAVATPYAEDDAIVARLIDLESERTGLASTLEELKAAGERSRVKVRELEALRRDFTSRRFDERGSHFPEGDLVGTMLTQFLRGAATREALWRVLEAQRRTSAGRSNPTFGSGGFGRGSPWGGGMSGGSRGRGGAGPFGGGSIGGGGFRTGGSIGGGGFRTGGRMGGGGFRTGGKR